MGRRDSAPRRNGGVLEVALGAAHWVGRAHSHSGNFADCLTNCWVRFRLFSRRRGAEIEAPSFGATSNLCVFLRLGGGVRFWD